MIDRFESEEYGRVIVLQNQTIGISVTQPIASRVLRIRVVTEDYASSELNSNVNLMLDRLLGLSVDLTDFYQIAMSDPKIKDLVDRFRGVKPPRFPTVFEAIVNAFACQQVSLNVGLLLLNRLAKNYGSHIHVNGRDCYSFPAPEKLATLDYQNIRNLGFSQRKSEYIIETAKLVTKDNFNLEDIDRMSDEEAVEALTQIRGVGRWTAEYVLLRGAGCLHVFPADDAGGQNSLCNWLHLRQKPDYGKAIKIISRWQPYAGMLYFHFLLHKLSSYENRLF